MEEDNYVIRMSTDRYGEEGQEEDEIGSMSGRDNIQTIIDDYQNLIEIQNQERKELLEKIDQLTHRTNEIENIDSRMQQFSALLMDIRQQIAALSKTKSLPVPKTSSTPKTNVLASQEEIDRLSKEVELKSTDLDQEISELMSMLDQKREEVNHKDVLISELNEKLDLLSEEKGRLAEELENLNSVIDSWKNQLDLLQKLAASDPRYRVIAALKKHGSLSDIQLAFTMGTSINQLRKYIEDLVELELVARNNAGRYVWIGKDFEQGLQ
jgi:chromosome segregation ATPase